MTPVENPFLTPILARAQATPGHLFAMLHDGIDWQQVTLGELLDRALRCAALLATQAVAPGAIVMIALRHGTDIPACFLGAMLAGAVPSFLPCPSARQDPDLYWSQHHVVFAAARPALIITCDDLLARMTDCAAGSGAVLVPLSFLDQTPATALPTPPAPSRIALLQHSSGTTGMKKGVALSYDAIVRQLATYAATIGLDAATDRIATWLPLYHDMGLVTGLLMPLWAGVPILWLDPFTWVGRPELLFDAVERHAGTLAWLPNFAFLHLARARMRSRYRLGTLRALVSCSEPCKPAAFDAFLDRFAAWGIRPGALQTCYAMAETVFAVAHATRPRRLSLDPACIADRTPLRPPPPGRHPVVLLSNGPPLDGCGITVRNADTAQPDGTIGELCIAADTLFAGYHNNPAATAAALSDGWYRTGDLGAIHDGEIYVVGRLKDVIIVNGRNIFAHDVEAAVTRLPGVKAGRAVAFGQPTDGSEALVVVAERSGPAADDRDTIRAINHAVIAETGTPCSTIRLVDAGWLVKTTSGKISREGNAAKYSKDGQGPALDPLGPSRAGVLRTTAPDPDCS